MCRKGEATYYSHDLISIATQAVIIDYIITDVKTALGLLSLVGPAS
jgi:hypothetical protein